MPGPRALKPHEKRVMDERKELDARRAALRTFIATETFDALDEHNKDLLALQLGAMDQYSAVLAMRIGLF